LRPTVTETSLAGSVLSVQSVSRRGRTILACSAQRPVESHSHASASRLGQRLVRRTVVGPATSHPGAAGFQITVTRASARFLSYTTSRSVVYVSGPGRSATIRNAHGLLNAGTHPGATGVRIGVTLRPEASLSG
jgi:hypothetical protein